jgi:hypothetical protein
MKKYIEELFKYVKTHIGNINKIMTKNIRLAQFHFLETLNLQR